MQIISKYFIDIVQSLILIGFIILRIYNVVDQQTLLIISIFVISSIIVKYLATTYLDFIINVRNTSFFQDNRTANFLTFDILKFILILIAISAVIVLGINRVLNNETIATLMGGLIGSLLTMKGSYSDLKTLSKEELNEITGVSSNQGSTSKSS